MRKTVTAALAFIVFAVILAGCASNNKRDPSAEAPVTVAQVNTGGSYAARAYIESLFYGDRPLFEACYPEGFLEVLNQSAGVDVYEEYRKIYDISGEFTGTGYADYRDYNVENGFDEAYIRSRISSVTDFEYDDIGKVQIQKIKTYFIYNGENASVDFYIITYEVGGSWYVLESVSGLVEF